MAFIASVADCINGEQLVQSTTGAFVTFVLAVWELIFLPGPELHAVARPPKSFLTQGLITCAGRALFHLFIFFFGRGYLEVNPI